MFSIRCGNCKQLINMKPDEMRTAIAETEAAGNVSYQMPCPKCRRPVRIPLKQLKLKLPRAVPESLDGKAAGHKDDSEG